MPKNNTPNNEWEQQYKREYNRIQQAIKRQEKLGYIVPEEVRPLKPSKIKTVTQQQVQQLIKLTPKEIRKRSIFINTDTGEAFEGLDIVKSSHVAKPSTAKVHQSKPPTTKKQSTTPKQQSDEELDPFWYGNDIEYVPEQHRQYYPGFENIAITGYFKQLQQFPNAEGARLLSRWLSRLIDQFGRHAVAVMLDEGSRAGNIVTWETVYKGGVQVYMTNMVEYLPGLDETEKQKLGEIMEEMESWESPL